MRRANAVVPARDGLPVIKEVAELHGETLSRH